VLHFENIVLGEGGRCLCTRCPGEVRAETLRDVGDIVNEIREVARAWGTRPGPNLMLTGAEPFHHPALPEILATAVCSGAQRIGLDSDCAALGSAHEAEAILESGVRHLQFTLLGSSPAQHDALSKRPGAFQETMGGVSTFIAVSRAANVPVYVGARIPVCHHDLRDLPTIVTAAARAGASFARVAVEDPGLDLRSAAPWIQAACDSGIVNGVWVEVQGVPYGLAKGWELHLSSVYHPVPGVKSVRCETCPLTSVCGGATLGARPEVTSAFKAWPEAACLAERIHHGFHVPGSSDV
jgi:hypothetical protein